MNNVVSPLNSITQSYHLIFLPSQSYSLTASLILSKTGNMIPDDIWRNQKKHPTKVMVWGAISANLQSDLIILDGSVDSKVYRRDILKKSRIIDHMNEVYGVRSWLFQQDGAPAHTSRKSIQYLERRCLVLDRWPPNSPDLNPIENLWAILERGLGKRSGLSLPQFKRRLIRTWNTVEWSIIENLIGSMQQRLELTLEHNGGCINGYF